MNKSTFLITTVTLTLVRFSTPKMKKPQNLQGFQRFYSLSQLFDSTQNRAGLFISNEFRKPWEIGAVLRLPYFFGRFRNWGRIAYFLTSIQKLGPYRLFFNQYPVHRAQTKYLVIPSPASLIGWSAELEGLIDISLGADIKYCAPPLASKMRSRLVIDFSLKGWDLVLRTACGAQNAFAFSRTG